VSTLPIDGALPALRDALRRGASAVLQAPPGAGKTTRVPLALLDERWLGGAKIIMLEPRRLAARAAARRMADTLGQRVGETVGFRVRMETRVGPATRVEVVTEGILTRMLQRDPTLEGVGLVIFDEFHERSVHADLGLALALQTRALVRDDLRLLVMSATLDGAAVAALLGGAPVVAGEGRSYPVETRYAAPRAGVRVEGAVAAAVRESLARHDGDLLVFLPGQGEIRRVEEALLAGPLPAGVTVAPLYGNLSQEQQDRAILPAPPRERKVVLATSIAETSLTIEGVRVVIDSGLARVPRFSPRVGMTRLETVRVSRAAADQRRGRAGRVGPGVCYRLWAEHEHHHLVAHATPEILEADLAPLALELAAAGVTDPAGLRWLDPPPAAAFAQARELLVELGALNAGGRVTPHGRRVAALGLHPRLAHMALAGAADGAGATGCALAALLAERDVLRGDGGPPEADLRLRLAAFAGERATGARADGDALRRARAEARTWRDALGIADAPPDLDACGALAALAYPDRVAQRRPGRRGRFLLRSGRGASLPEHDPLADASYLAVAETDGGTPESRIFLAAPVALEELEARFAEQVVVEEVVEWDDAAGAVAARRRTRLGALVLRDAPLRDPDPERVAAVFLDAVARGGADALPWTPAARRLQERMRFLHAVDPAWPDVSDAALAATMRSWLAPQVLGMRRRDELARLDLAEALRGMLGWEQRAALDASAPTHVVVPSGSRIPVDYSDPATPVLAVRLQEVFGLTETPRVGGGRVPLTMHLLSPAHRPVQVTRDLAGFWRTSYFDVRKDLRGRYPKHHWPEDPLAATATRHAKRRGE
jgi:ATP-dependent helicase HrpB